jgi:sterol desaturase/sphingolipid hydroxylase (fatty acid hydroxylase superfamily)
MQISEQQFQVIRAVGFVLAFGGALALQRWLPHARERGSWRVNGGLWLVNGIVVGLVCGGCACSTSNWAAAHGLGLFNVTAVPAWIAALLSLAILDLVSYGWHRANHRLPFLWRFHRVHHSDRSFTVTTAIRFHPGELLLSLPVRLTAVVLFGVPIIGVLAFELVFMLANLVEHGDIALPRRIDRVLALVCVTPPLHRRHHTRRRPELDSNFGTVLSIWDRMLGTYRHAGANERIETGAPGIDRPLGLVEALRLPVGQVG